MQGFCFSPMVRALFRGAIQVGIAGVSVDASLFCSLVPFVEKHLVLHLWRSHGVPDAQVAALMGHSGTAMLHKHYVHLGARAKALREALSKVR